MFSVEAPTTDEDEAVSLEKLFDVLSTHPFVMKASHRKIVSDMLGENAGLLRFFNQYVENPKLFSFDLSNLFEIHDGRVQLKCSGNELDALLYSFVAEFGDLELSVKALKKAERIEQLRNNIRGVKALKVLLDMSSASFEEIQENMAMLFIRRTQSGRVTDTGEPDKGIVAECEKLLAPSQPQS